MSSMRLMGFLLLIGLTFYLPKIASEGGLQRAKSMFGASDGSIPPLATTAVSSSENSMGEYGSGQGPPINLTSPVVARQMLSYDQFLRFDVTPEWVTKQFRQVTILPTAGGEAMRVALVTGTRPNDLVGSLTYYFDHKPLVQRIRIDGATGDATELTSFIQQNYKLNEISRGVYVRQFGKTVLNGLIVERSGVIQDTTAGALNREYHVVLELNRPADYAHVSANFQQHLKIASGR